MKVLITGSRKWVRKDLIKMAFANIPAWATIIHGGARGADTLADEVARELGYTVHVEKPDYDTFFWREAPLRRNDKMLDMLDPDTDKVIGFQCDTKDGGTGYTLKGAEQRGIKTEIITL